MEKVNNAANALLFSFVVCIFCLVPSEARAALIQLQNGTATFSQLINGGPFTPAQAVDGNIDANGWAIAVSQVVDGTSAQTAVWETDADLAAGNLTLTMHFLQFNPGHLLGRFRFSVTTEVHSLTDFTPAETSAQTGPSFPLRPFPAQLG